LSQKNPLWRRKSRKKGLFFAPLDVEKPKKTLFGAGKIAFFREF